jgi:hypothetical protein
MYGLDAGTDLSALDGSALTFVGFGEYQLQLAFTGSTNCAISVEGDYKVAGPGGTPITYRDAVAGSAALLQLLGRTVESANVPEGGMVRLVFDDGSLVEVLDSKSDYESYQLNLGPRLIVV